MSYSQPEQYGRGTWKDMERSLVNASRITQDPEGAQRAYVPPIPVPQEPRNEWPEDRFSMFNRRHNGQSIMGRGQMIIEQERSCNVGFRDLRISQDLRGVVPGFTGYSDSAIQQIISSSGQFDDDMEEDPDEPSFNVTSTPSTSGIKEAVAIHRAFTPTSPSSRVGLYFTETSQGAVDPSGIEDTDTPLDHPIVPESLCIESAHHVSASDPELSSDHPETSLDQPETSYLDPFYYKFDDSIYIKVDAPIASFLEGSTPSPCSSPLPYHSTVDGQYIGCVQMESGSSSSPSPIFEPDLADILAHQNAADFSTRLRSTLPDDYHEVMSVWKYYQAGQITSSALELQISRLLGPYPDLMDSFFKFTSLSPSEEPESLIVGSFNEVLEVPNEPISEAREIPDERIREVLGVHDERVSEVLQAPDESVSEAFDKPVTEVDQENINEVPNEPINVETEKTRAELFEDYIRFCRLVRNKFATQPDVFPEFLALLNDHKEAKIDKKSMVDRASHLFRFHIELVEGFKKLTAGKFCSVLIKTAAGSIAAGHRRERRESSICRGRSQQSKHSDEDSTKKKVACLTDSTRPRRIRNFLILNLLKKEAASKEAPAEDKSNEVSPVRIVCNGGLIENHAKNSDEKINKKACDENGYSDVRESVCVLNDLGVPSSTTLGYNSADVEIGEVSTTVLDNIVDSSDGVPCPVRDYDVMLVQIEPSCDSSTAESNLEGVPDLEVADSLADSLQLTDLGNSLPLAPTIQDRPLELLKPEDIIPDMNAEVPHSTLEMAHEIVTSNMDSVVVQGDVEELIVAHVENEITGSSEGCVKAEIELLKPSDFVHLEPNAEEVCETVNASEESVVMSPAVIALDTPENLTVVELNGEMVLSDSVEVLCSGDEAKSVDAISVSVEILSSLDAIAISTESASSSADGKPSSVDVATSCLDVPSGQNQYCVVDSTSVQLSDAMEIKPMYDTEQVLDTVVVALSKMDLNSDLVKEVEPAIELESSSDTVFVDAIPLPPSSDESSEGGYKEILSDEPTGAKVTMTVHAITSDLQTPSAPDVDQSADQAPASVPQVTPDSGPKLLRPDQLVTLSTAVDPHQVQQALQKHSADLISLD